MCALGENISPSTTSDICDGDSGGPLFCTFNGVLELHGISSWGSADCGKAVTPSIYARVHERATHIWIKKKITKADPIPVWSEWNTWSG